MAKCNIDRNYYSALANIYGIVGAINLTGAQLSKISRISDDMISVLGSTTMSDERYSGFNDVRKDALAYFYMFNDANIINDAIDMLNRVEYYSDDTYDYSMFTVLSNAIKTNTGAYKVPARVIVPNDLKKTSSVFLAHDIAHMLKERNVRECQEINNFGEVIPMLLELIIAYSYEYENTESILGKRSKMIKTSSKCFKELYDEYKSNASLCDDKVVLAALNESGNYVNSFYYTLALFAVYLREPDYMKVLIANVLNGKMTTRDLITYTVHDSYNLYLDGLKEFNSSL